MCLFIGSVFERTGKGEMNLQFVHNLWRLETGKWKFSRSLLSLWEDRERRHEPARAHSLLQETENRRWACSLALCLRGQGKAKWAQSLTGDREKKRWACIWVHWKETEKWKNEPVYGFIDRRQRIENMSLLIGSVFERTGKRDMSLLVRSFFTGGRE